VGHVTEAEFACEAGCDGVHRLGRGFTTCERLAVFRYHQHVRMTEEMKDQRAHDARYDPDSLHRAGVRRAWRRRSRAPEDNSMYGRRHRPESIERMRAAALAREARKRGARA
jgi:serine/threonine protein kinase HipA of HipAB toxin-antitoxin module